MARRLRKPKNLTSKTGVKDGGDGSREKHYFSASKPSEPIQNKKMLLATVYPLGSSEAVFTGGKFFNLY